MDEEPNEPNRFGWVVEIDPFRLNYGHIIRWYYRQDWTEPTFGWDIFALCGDSENPVQSSTIFGDKYGSPDGIYVDPSGLLWDSDGCVEVDD